MRNSRKAKALIVTTLLLTNGVTTNANNDIPTEISQQIGYDRWFNVIESVDKNDGKKFVEINVEISFYTSLIEENTSLGGIDAQGNPLTWGTIAVPRSVALGTKFEIEGYEGTTFVARDRGSVKHIRIKEDGTYRIDMFIPRKKGENNNQYWQRVNAYGKIKRKAKMYIEN